HSAAAPATAAPIPYRDVLSVVLRMSPLVYLERFSRAVAGLRRALSKRVHPFTLFFFRDGPPLSPRTLISLRPLCEFFFLSFLFPCPNSPQSSSFHRRRNHRLLLRSQRRHQIGRA